MRMGGGNVNVGAGEGLFFIFLIVMPISLALTTSLWFAVMYLVVLLAGAFFYNKRRIRKEFNTLKLVVQDFVLKKCDFKSYVHDFGIYHYMITKAEVCFEDRIELTYVWIDIDGKLNWDEKVLSINKNNFKSIKFADDKVIITYDDGLSIPKFLGIKCN